MKKNNKLNYNVKKILMVGPFSSRSGYGDHARDMFHAFNKFDFFTIKVIDTPWGDCPRNALDQNNKKDKTIMSSLLNQDTMVNFNADIGVDVRIPNEFETVGKYFNIGITAGIETSQVSPAFIEGVNKMDMTIVPSNHSKAGFVETKYDKAQVDKVTGEKVLVGELSTNKPIEVLFEGVDTDIFKPISNNDIDKNIKKMIDNIPEENLLLHVGQWVKGGYGEDRKDIGRLIKLFCETFMNKNGKVALVLKTSGATFSILDRERIIEKIKIVKNQFLKIPNVKLPNVYLIHGDLSQEELNGLYNHDKIKAMVSLTHGEGFGRPLLEATMSGLPVVASNWSGHIDFLNSELSLLVGGLLEKVPTSAVWENIIMEESMWFVVDEAQTKGMLEYSINNSTETKTRATKLMKINRDKFSWDSMVNELHILLDRYLKDIEVKKDESSLKQLKLPKLNKTNSVKNIHKNDKLKLSEVPVV